MADDSNDVLMTFLMEGKGVAAECQAVWAKDDGMKADFTDGHFFEIEDFSFGGGLEPSDYHEEENDGVTTFPRQGLSTRNPLSNQVSGGGSRKSKKARRNKFTNYFTKGDAVDYGAHLQDISVSRLLDVASPNFLQYCLEMKSFTKAVIVKRKVVGKAHGGTREHRGFLRLEFEEPLITGVEWEDGEVVKEKLKFICRGVTVTYRPQQNDGSLGNPVNAHWNWKTSLKNSG